MELIKLDIDHIQQLKQRFVNGIGYDAKRKVLEHESDQWQLKKPHIDWRISSEWFQSSLTLILTR